MNTKLFTAAFTGATVSACFAFAAPAAVATPFWAHEASEHSASISSQVVATLSDKDTTASFSIETLQGSDGLHRWAVYNKKSGIDGKKITLYRGDTLQISEDAKQVRIVNRKGNTVGTFNAPEIVTDDGEVTPAKFSIRNGNYVTLDYETPQYAARSCWRATLGKWTYRVGAGGICTAFGLGTSGVGGFACGLGAAYIEDKIPFNSVC